MVGEEHLTPSFYEPKEKNTVALVWLILSIIWLIFFITIFWIILAIPLLVLWFILWVIGLFFKPRGKAIAAIIISLIPWIIVYAFWFFLWSNVKMPTQEFVQWAETTFTWEEFKNIDQERFNAISQYVGNNYFERITTDEMEAMFNEATGSNSIEKGAYFFFDLVKNIINESVELYNSDIAFDLTGSSALWSSLNISISTNTGELEDEIISGDDTACTMIYEPVCWVDGQVYWNSCVLEKAGIELDETATATESWCVSE